MHLEHHLVGGYVRYISPHIIIIIITILDGKQLLKIISENYNGDHPKLSIKQYKNSVIESGLVLWCLLDGKI